MKFIQLPHNALLITFLHTGSVIAARTIGNARYWYILLEALISTRGENQNTHMSYHNHLCHWFDVLRSRRHGGIGLNESATDVNPLVRLRAGEFTQ